MIPQECHRKSQSLTKKKYYFYFYFFQQSSTTTSQLFLQGYFVSQQSPTMGKVHGSLARAGKVKKQTPKVKPTDKKKLPTGRAKKRLLYAKRFVNVIKGVKKSPNSNAK